MSNLLIQGEISVYIISSEIINWSMNFGLSKDLINISTKFDFQKNLKNISV